MKPKQEYCAKLLLWDLDLMTKSERGQLAAWLRRTAMGLMKIYSADRYSPLFTAKYMSSRKRPLT